MTNKSDTQLLVRAAIAAVRGCADTMDAQAAGLQQALPAVPMTDELRTDVMRQVAALKDTSGRVTFELALLQSQLADGQSDDAAAVQRLSGMDAAMLAPMSALADVVEGLESAAERDETHERAFVLVIEAIGILMQGLERARTATQALAVASVRPSR
jgi:hypothetical protein